MLSTKIIKNCILGETAEWMFPGESSDKTKPVRHIFSPPDRRIGEQLFGGIDGYTLSHAKLGAPRGF